MEQIAYAILAVGYGYLAQKEAPIAGVYAVVGLIAAAIVLF